MRVLQGSKSASSALLANGRTISSSTGRSRTSARRGRTYRVPATPPSPPLKLLVRRFLAHRMRATARHWWLPWPLACRVAGFLVQD